MRGVSPEDGLNPPPHRLDEMAAHRRGEGVERGGARGGAPKEQGFEVRVGICRVRPDGISCLQMTLTVNIPDDLAAELGAGFHNLGRAALEALAAEAYARDVLSLEQVRRLLELESRWEAQAVLSRLGAWPAQSAEDILEDARRSFEFRQAVK